MKTEILDELFGARDALSDMLIKLQPTTEAETEEMKRLVARRDRLTGAINAIIAAEFDDLAKGLPERVASLAERTKELTSLKNRLDQVSAAIGLVDQIVQVASSIISVVKPV